MPAPKGPNYVICYLCGRKYGTKSIAIHEPSCIKKWHAENQKLPKHLRRKLPTKPDYSKLSSGDFDGNYVDQMNEMSYKAAQEQLIPCENCGRTFLPDRLGVHQKSCTADNPAHRTTTKSRTNKLGYDPNPYPQQAEETTTSNVDSKPKSQKSKREILCCLCMKQIPSSIIQNHLVRCNEEKSKNLRKNSNNRTNAEIEQTTEEMPERPATRTLNRESDPKLSSATYDLDSPEEEEQEYVPKQKPNKQHHQRPQKSTTQRQHSPPQNHGGSYEDGGIQEGNLVNCSLCNRHFAAERIDKHTVICQKTKSKARKVFDSSKQRLEGTEAASVPRRSNQPQTKSSKGNWRQTHQDFIRSIRAAKQVTKHMQNGGKASDLPPPPPSLNPDYVHCQYCDRRFNPEVAQRHIPKCATTMNRPKPPKQKALDVYNKSNSNPVRAASKNGKRSALPYNQNQNINGNSREMSFSSNNRSARRNDIRNSPKGHNGYNYPKIDRGYDNFNSTPPPSSAHSSRRGTNNNNNRMQQNDPYKPKTFSGLNNRQASNRGFSYNAMNHTGPNFFG